MTLLAFVLVLVAAVTLAMGTLLGAGTVFIWISIGTCLATFLVLAISSTARRATADDEAAEPEPLVASGTRAADRAPVADRVAAAAPAPGPAAGHEGTTVADQDATTADNDVAAQDTDVGGDAAGGDDAPAPEPRTVATGATPAPAAVAPNGAGVDEQEEAAAHHDVPEQAMPVAAPSGTRRVVRRSVPSGDGPRRVVRRVVATGDRPRTVVRRVVVTADGTRRPVRRSSTDTDTDTDTDTATDTARPIGAGDVASPRRVVRRTRRVTGDAPRRVVRRVVRSTAGERADDGSGEASGPVPGEQGTRGEEARAVLAGIRGVGPARQDALLRAFGSLEQMAAASIETLAAVTGGSTAVATEIRQVLRDR